MCVCWPRYTFVCAFSADDLPSHFWTNKSEGKKNINGMYAAVGIMGMNAHGIWNRTVFFFSHLVCGVVFAPALVLGSNGSAGCGSQPLFISHYT